ncbi:CBS domain-containing protein [Changchengzhania lutea]|uniref:CBS domain-containing protein n=1 Tax=Changchengzhania lutea TaxID=2049305 RepID=UPI00115D8D2A|nr:CBS domain-containing protein [Changchengzhania lutea]
MKQREPVSTIMSTTLIALTRADDLEKAETLFKRHHIRHIPVVNGEAVIGILSYSDLLKISFANVTNDEHNVESVVYNMFTIEQVMVKNVETIGSDTPIKEAAEILSKRDYHALPVVDDETLVGMVTTTDLLNYFVNQF